MRMILICIYSNPFGRLQPPVPRNRSPDRTCGSLSPGKVMGVAVSHRDGRQHRDSSPDSATVAGRTRGTRRVDSAIDEREPKTARAAQDAGWQAWLDGRWRKSAAHRETDLPMTQDPTERANARTAARLCRISGNQGSAQLGGSTGVNVSRRPRETGPL